jgi:hypothetical protein
MEETFNKYLPDTMYMSHYQLAEYYGHTPQEWRKFLRDNSLFIESELAAIAEAEARAALSKLANASGTEVQALKAILEKSKLINDAQKQNTKVVLTYVPDAWKEQSVKEKVTENQLEDPNEWMNTMKPITERKVARPQPKKEEELPEINPYDLF